MPRENDDGDAGLEVPQRLAEEVEEVCKVAHARDQHRMPPHLDLAPRFGREQRVCEPPLHSVGLCSAVGENSLPRGIPGVCDNLGCFYRRCCDLV